MGQMWLRLIGPNFQASLIIDRSTRSPSAKDIFRRMSRYTNFEQEGRERERDLGRGKWNRKRGKFQCVFRINRLAGMEYWYRVSRWGSEVKAGKEKKDSKIEGYRYKREAKKDRERSEADGQGKRKGSGGKGRNGKYVYVLCWISELLKERGREREQTKRWGKTTKFRRRWRPGYERMCNFECLLLLLGVAWKASPGEEKTAEHSIAKSGPRCAGDVTALFKSRYGPALFELLSLSGPVWRRKQSNCHRFPIAPLSGKNWRQAQEAGLIVMKNWTAQNDTAASSF